MNTNRRKSFRTVADVLHSSLAELAALQRKPAQKTDRVMRASKLEDNIYAELREDDTEMDMTENAAAQRLRSFPALSRDVFQSLYSLAPRRNDADMLTAAAQRFNAPILDHVAQQDDYPTLKNICEGRSLSCHGSYIFSPAAPCKKRHRKHRQETRQACCNPILSAAAAETVW